jgi:hypothetical protein
MHTFTPVCRRYEIALWHLAELNPVKWCVDTLPDMNLGAVSKLWWSREYGCIEEEQRAVVRFCTQKMLKGLKFRHAYVLSFGTSVTDSECSGLPSTASDDKQEQARDMILKDTNKCKVFRHVMKWTEASHWHKTMRKISRRCAHLVQQYSTSYCCLY